LAQKRKKIRIGSKKEKIRIGSKKEKIRIGSKIRKIRKKSGKNQDWLKKRKQGLAQKKKKRIGSKTDIVTMLSTS
jgi:hypothetical protein